MMVPPSGITLFRENAEVMPEMGASPALEQQKLAQILKILYLCESPMFHLSLNA